METIEFDEACPPCDGTGLYAGLAEHDGVAVICRNCKGTGCHHFKYSYTPFVSRKVRGDVERVFKQNIGVVIGSDNGHQLTDFGGLPYSEWRGGKQFTIGTEDREHSCPARWYQADDSCSQPDWDECVDAGEAFKNCKNYWRKSKCWQRFDKANH